MSTVGVDAVGTSVVIVNYRTKELTRDAVASVLTEPEVREVVVVDNASADGSAEYLAAAFADRRVRLVGAERNLGFGAAVNLATRECRSPLLLILNSDATLVPRSLGRLAADLVADDAVGVVAPAVYEADGMSLQPGNHGRLPGRRDIVMRRTRAERAGADIAHAVRPGWVSGVAMLLRRTDFLAVGGFDEGFAMYLEDVDLCRRLADAGKSVRRQPSAGVVHRGGRSWQSRRDQVRQLHESKLRYFENLGATRFELLCVRVAGAVRTARARP